MSSTGALIMFFKAPTRDLYKAHSREPHIASKFGHLAYSQDLGRSQKYLRGQDGFLQIQALTLKQIGPCGCGVLKAATLLINLVF